MKPLNPSKNPSPFYSLKLRITGYLCDCGHWNNIKRRKPKQNVQAVPTLARQTANTQPNESP